MDITLATYIHILHEMANAIKRKNIKMYFTTAWKALHISQISQAWVSRRGN